MKVCVLSQPLQDDQKLPECDLAVFGFRALGEVKYEDEISGKAQQLEAVARCSLNNSCGVLCACTTTGRGLVRRSVAAAYRGKILGICDMLHVFDEQPYKAGAALGFFDFGGVKVGVCVENDLLFPESVRALCDCGCHLLVGVREAPCDEFIPTVIRAYSYLYGTPVVLSAAQTSLFTESGKLMTVQGGSPVFSPDVSAGYAQVHARARGGFTFQAADYG